MKIAIAATECTFSATVDSHFGHSHCFVIFGPDSDTVSFVPNPYRDDTEKAGEMTLQMLLKQGVSKIISLDFGKQIQPMMDQQKVQMIIVNSAMLQVDELISMLRKSYQNSIKPKYKHS